MRAYRSEVLLREIAKNVSEEIVIRTYDERGSHDTRRSSTKPEREIIYGVIVGALYNLNFNRHSLLNDNMTQVVCDTAEFIAGRFLPEANCYDTIYLPLKKIIKDWEEE